MLILDTPNNVTRYLPRMGEVETVIRYITTNYASEKHVKVPEIKAIKAAGKTLGLVFEVWGDFKHAGAGGICRADGVRAGQYARSILPKLGAPAGACVYFAVDVEASKAQIANNVIPYFEEVRAAFADGEYRVGVYGPGSVCKAVKEAGLCDLTWLANAKGWSGYTMWLPQCDLLQKLQTKAFGGLDVDPDEAKNADWGQFDPFADDALLAPAGIADLDDSDPGSRRLGMGEDNADDRSTVGDTAHTSFGGGLYAIKSMFKSKIAWLTGVLGGTSATSAITSDPEAMSLVERLGHKPAFWMTIAALIIAGAIVYYRWRDHGKGSA